MAGINIDKPSRTASVFCAYARADERYLDELRVHLSMLRRQDKIAFWYDRSIDPGTEWETEIDQHINTADLILLLMSPNFIHSDYCFGIELQEALRRHNSAEAKVIPVILRPCEWKETDLAKIQALPRDGTPISQWPDADDAWYDVTRGIRRVIEALQEGGTISDIELLPEDSTVNSVMEPPPVKSLSERVGALTRRLKVEWSTEEESDKWDLNRAKSLMSESGSELMAIRTSDEVDRRAFLHRSIDLVIAEMKRFERHRTWLDEFHYKEFWWLGSETIERLEAISSALQKMSENGVDPMNSADLQRLLGDKACLRLAPNSEKPIRGKFRNSYLLVELPLFNEGKAIAREVTLLSVDSELDSNAAHIEKIESVIAPEQEGSLFFLYKPTYVGEPPQAQESRFRLRIGFRDGLGNDVVGYTIRVRDAQDRTFIGEVVPERGVASPLCRGLIQQV